MASSNTRADYEQLNKIAQKFDAESQNTAHTLGGLHNCVERLRAGDWVGKGATAFYAEFDAQIAPALTRLSRALGNAAQVTRDIASDVQRTEQEIAAVLQQDEQLSGGTAQTGTAAQTDGGGFWGGLWDGVKSVAGGVWEGVKQVGGFIEGFVLQGIDTVAGLWNIVSDPIGTVKGLWYAVTHPGEAWEAIKKPFVDDWNSGNYGRALGRGAFEIVGLFAGGAGAVGKGGKVASIADKAADAARIADKAADAARVADKAADAAKIVDDAGDAAKAADRASDAGKVIDAADNAPPPPPPPPKVPPLDFSKIDIQHGMNHIKYRDISVPRKKGIGGAHDADEFAKIRQVDEAGYTMPKGQDLASVPEIVVSGRNPHPSVPGVEIIDYKIPTVDKTMKTTGDLKAVDPKTVYDPKVWSDAKLQTAVQEALQDAANRNGGVVPELWTGVTKEGYPIRGYFRDGKITTFYFE
jgi:WXG100 family type VII secretion target